MRHKVLIIPWCPGYYLNMRRKAILLLLISIVSMAMVAQTKLTPSAMLRMAKQKARVTNAARIDAVGDKADSQSIQLVVKIDPTQAAETFDQLRQAGAEIKARIGRHAVVSVPLDRVQAIEAINGVQRIDVGHKPQFKTDVTRSVTGVSLLNGTAVPQPETSYTGKGVTLCIFDTGIDFQHPAFKDSEGNSRIKCVYMIGDDGGNKFTVNDPEAGEITFPGSVYDTPELIATLTTDDAEEYHGTHTAGIAAGSLSPMGFGGMAPEADLVFIAINEDGIDEDADVWEIMELILAFAAAYADQSDQPMVFSCSANDHGGPHNGTGAIPEAIEDLSAHCIPVFSAGNEGGYPIHLHRVLAKATTKVTSLLMPYDEADKGYYYSSNVTGFTRVGEEVSVQLSVINITMTGKINTVWTSEKMTATTGCEPSLFTVSSDEDVNLAKYFNGQMSLMAGSQEDGKLFFSTMLEGETTSDLTLCQISFTGAAGTEFDAWEGLAGFYSSSLMTFGDPIGDSEMSGGDWTSTPSVISVGAWCSNTNYRSYDGSPEEVDEDDENSYVEGDYAWFSSYGTMFNGVEQPTVCAPGVNIVSSWNHYTIADDETVLDDMQWQGFPYGAESGTSMSCPVVSGIVALWLQARPDLTLDDVKQLLRESSLNDDFTAAAPERFGYGKIDAAKGIACLAEMSGVSEVKANERPSATMLFDLQGRRVDNRQAARGIYIRGNRKTFVK